MPWVNSVSAIVHAWYLNNTFREAKSKRQVVAYFPESRGRCAFLWTFPLRKQRGMLHLSVTKFELGC